MGPDEKDTGLMTVYMDGQPVGTAYGEIPEISTAAEEPTEAVPPAMISGGSAIITMERVSEAMKLLAEAWGAICTALDEAARAVSKIWRQHSRKWKWRCAGRRLTTARFITATATPKRSGSARSTPSGSWPGIGRRACNAAIKSE